MSLLSSKKVVDAAGGQKTYFFSLMFEMIKYYKKDDYKESMSVLKYLRYIKIEEKNIGVLAVFHLKMTEKK